MSSSSPEPNGLSVSELSQNINAAAIMQSPNNSGNMASSPTSPTSPLSGNPLKLDPQLQALVHRLDELSSSSSAAGTRSARRRTFLEWKASFLRRFQSFVQESGMEPAQTAYGKLGQQLQALLETLLPKLDQKLQQQAATSVSGRRALQEVTYGLQGIVEELQALIPGTQAEERRQQYSKYHLGCVLIQDGFLEYDRMVQCQEALQRMMETGGLANVVNKQQQEAMEAFDRQIIRFVDVMRDLGLYGVMVTCRELLSKSHDDEDVIVLMDPKTGAVMEFPRSLCFQKGVLTLSSRQNNPEGGGGEEVTTERIREQAYGIERDELISTLQAQFAL